MAFEEMFRHHALAMLKADGFTDAEIGRLLPPMGHRFAKTNSRPVIGSMNNHVENSRWYFEHDGGLKIADVRAINRQLNRTPMGAQQRLGSHMDFQNRGGTRLQDHQAFRRGVIARQREPPTPV